MKSKNYKTCFMYNKHYHKRILLKHQPQFIQSQFISLRQNYKNKHPQLEALIKERVFDC